MKEYQFEDNKIIFIADTHLGSKLDNIIYIKMVHDYAINNNIKTIIHLGDIFQSTLKPVKKEYILPETQINLVYALLKSYESITTYLLLGNHDFHLLKKNSEYLNMLNTIPNLNILGFKMTYVLWQDSVISLHHEINNYNIQLPYLKTLLDFYGHRHSLKIKDNKIYLPCLCDDVKFYENAGSVPGFLTAEIKDNEIIIENLELTPNIENKGIILKRTRKNPQA